MLSRALLRGFITAVGVEIFILQMIPLCGLEGLLANTPNVVTALDKVVFLVQNLENVHFLTLGVSGLALALLILAKMFKSKLVLRPGFKFLAYIPEVLLVVIISTREPLRSVFKTTARNSFFRAVVLSAYGCLQIRSNGTPCAWQSFGWASRG